MAMFLSMFCQGDCSIGKPCFVIVFIMAGKAGGNKDFNRVNISPPAVASPTLAKPTTNDAKQGVYNVDH